jgi:acetylglutamate kinase
MSVKLVSTNKTEELSKKGDVTEPRLSEAIPYINAFSGKRFVLKIGGSVLDDLSLLPSLIDDVVFLKKVEINVVLVHGGSRHLNKAMEQRGMKVESIDGLRVTSPEVLELAANVFHEISVAIEKEIKKHGYKCVIFGRESGLVKSKQIANPQLGFVGDPQSVEITLLEGLADNVIPIVSSVTAGVKQGDIGFNVNADDVAGIVAAAIKAEKVIFMTNVKGVLDEQGNLLSSLTVSQTEDLIKKKVIHGGMIPKVNTCLNALKRGARKCHIIEGSTHSFMNEILTDKGIGTEFVKDNEISQQANKLSD